MDFLNSQLTKLIMVGTCVVVLLFILGKLGAGIIKKILIGAFLGGGVSAILYFIFHLPLQTVGIIGIITFLLSAICGKISS